MGQNVLLEKKSCENKSCWKLNFRWNICLSCHFWTKNVDSVLGFDEKRKNISPHMAHLPPELLFIRIWHIDVSYADFSKFSADGTFTPSPIT